MKLEVMRIHSLAKFICRLQRQGEGGVEGSECILENKTKV